jgi:hypothetical protein
MIDLTDYFTRVNIGLGLALVALLLTLNFFAKFPTKKVSPK